MRSTARASARRRGAARRAARGQGRFSPPRGPRRGEAGAERGEQRGLAGREGARERLPEDEEDGRGSTCCRSPRASRATRRAHSGADRAPPRRLRGPSCRPGGRGGGGGVRVALRYRSTTGARSFATISGMLREKTTRRPLVHHVPAHHSSEWGHVCVAPGWMRASVDPAPSTASPRTSAAAQPSPKSVFAMNARTLMSVRLNASSELPSRGTGSACPDARARDPPSC